MFRLLFYPSGIITWGIIGMLSYQALEEYRFDADGRERTPIERIEALTGLDVPAAIETSPAPSETELDAIKAQILSELEYLGPAPDAPPHAEPTNLDHETDTAPPSFWERILQSPSLSRVIR